MIGCIYRPPSTAHAQVHAVFDDMKEQMQSVISRYPSQRIMVSGDVNADERTNPVAYARLKELRGTV